MATQNQPDSHASPAAIGIDFGTSKCCVAAVRGGRVHVLQNEFGQRTTPSCVAFTYQQRLVGGAALDQAVVNCANTVHAVKRTLGRTYDQVKAIPSACKIERDDSSSDTFHYCVDYRKRQLQLSPEQITAMLLTKMKNIAESSLGCPVKQAVISVPASFGNAQRAALLTAARVAGLEVLQLINETTAAGVAFEDNRTVKTAVTIAVVDFGAGKLDVSLMEVKEGSVRVIAAAGSPYLGGCYLDEVLVEHCCNVMRQKHGNELRIDDKAYVKLRLASAKVKNTLSFLPEAQLSIESFVENMDVNMPVSRRDFNEKIKIDVCRKIVGTFDYLFKQKSITKDTIDNVVLVGGSTRIPAVKSILEEYFGGHKLDQTVNQDEAVAQGAALCAAAITGAAAGVQVADVISYDICFCDRCKREWNLNWILPRCPSIPFIEYRTFTKKPNRKTSPKVYSFREQIDVVDGYEYRTSLGTFTIDRTNIITKTVNADLILQVDMNGMFTFSIASKEDQWRFKVEPINFHPHRIDAWVKAEEQFRKETAAEAERVNAEMELESLCFELQSALSSPELDKYCPSRELESYKKLVSKAFDWMATNVEHALGDQLSQKITELHNAKKDVEQLLNAGQQAVLTGKEKDTFKSLLFEIDRAVNDSDLERYSDSQELELCKDTLSSFKTWAKNIESASSTQISQKLEELSHEKKKVHQLKADAVRVKSLVKEKVAVKLAELDMLTDKIVDFKSLLSEVNCALNDSYSPRYFDSQKFESCKKALSSFVTWKESSSSWKSASLAQVSQKLEELTRLKNEVDKLKADA